MVRHGASSKIKYFRVLLYMGSQAESRYTLERSRFSEEKREKERVTPEFGEGKEEKNSTPKFRALQSGLAATPVARRNPTARQAGLSAALQGGAWPRRRGKGRLGLARVELAHIWPRDAGASAAQQQVGRAVVHGGATRKRVAAARRRDMAKHLHRGRVACADARLLEDGARG